MGPRHQGSKAETLALDAYLKLMRAADSVAARAHVALPAHLTLTQFAALEALYLLKSGGNLTLVVKNLERDGLVTRTRETGDRRFVKVELTPKGRRFIGALFPKIAANLTREFAIVSARDQLALARICKQLGRGRLLTAFTAR